jgi:protoporphyrinogen/coproporphyrinogen III oxidase
MARQHWALAAHAQAGSARHDCGCGLGKQLHCQRVSEPKVAIIGAGVAGLTAGFRLRERRPLIFEASGRIGGQIQTEASDGYLIERGGEGFVSRSLAIPALATDLGLPESELLGQSTLQSYGFDGGQLVPLRPGEAASFLGFQVQKQDLGKGIRSLRRGMGSLIAALEASLRDVSELRLQTRVSRVCRQDGALRLEFERGEPLHVDALIVATSAAVAAELLNPLAGESARALSSAATHSSVTVELAYDRSAVDHPLDGTGFVIAASAQQQDGLRACTFTTSKFAGRSPPERVSLRLFFRPAPHDEAQSDAQWVQRAERALGRVLSVRAGALRSWVSRWPRALPVFDAGLRAQIEALENCLSPHAVLLAGSAFHGSGMDAAVCSAERTAAALLGDRKPPARAD